MSAEQNDPRIDWTKLRDAVLPIVSSHGCETVDLELKMDRHGWVLRLGLEKQGAAEKRLTTEQAAVDLERCAEVSRALSATLDEVDIIPFHYTLEVGSPGVERTLRSVEDFVRFTGQKAKFRVSQPVQGLSVLTGYLAGADAEAVQLDTGKGIAAIPLPSIRTARLVFEFPKSPKRPTKKTQSPRNS